MGERRGGDHQPSPQRCRRLIAEAAVGDTSDLEPSRVASPTALDRGVSPRWPQDADRAEHGQADPAGEGSAATVAISGHWPRRGKMA
jgi:hypothetical protein